MRILWGNENYRRCAHMARCACVRAFLFRPTRCLCTCDTYKFFWMELNDRYGSGFRFNVSHDGLFCWGTMWLLTLTKVENNSADKIPTLEAMLSDLQRVYRTFFSNSDSRKKKSTHTHESFAKYSQRIIWQIEFFFSFIRMDSVSVRYLFLY